MPLSLDGRPRIRHPPASWQSIICRLLPEPRHIPDLIVLEIYPL